MSETLPMVEERSIAPQGAAEIVDQENLIKRKIELLDKLKGEIKETKQMYEDSFNNNPVFVQKKKAADEAAIQRKKTAYLIAKEPGVANLKKKLEDLQLNKRDLEKGISQLLLDFTEKQPEVKQLELFDGRFASIVKTAKLSKPKKPKMKRRVH